MGKWCCLISCFETNSPKWRALCRYDCDDREAEDDELNGNDEDDDDGSDGEGEGNA